MDPNQNNETPGVDPDESPATDPADTPVSNPGDTLTPDVQPSPTMPAAQPSMEQMEQQAKPPKNKKMLYLIVVVLVLGLGALLYFFVFLREGKCEIFSNDFHF